MTRDEAREFAKVVQAYADGKVIQVRSRGNLHWNDVVIKPSFNTENGEWRIKTEPREFFITLDRDNDVRATHKTLDSAARSQRERDVDDPYSPFTVVHVREVMP